MQLTDNVRNLLKDCANPDFLISGNAQRALAKTVEKHLSTILYPEKDKKAKAAGVDGEVIREGVMWGDIVSDIFTQRDFPAGTTIEYPLHFLAPGTEKEHVAYVVPRQGYIPQREVQGDYIQLPSFKVGNSIDFEIDYAYEANWEVMGAGLEVFRDGFVKKRNDDGFHTLIAAGVDRNIVVYDADANAGQFTKRVVSLTRSTMRRNGGGNSSSMNQFNLTDLFVSYEAEEDVLNWNIDQVDEQTRREIWIGNGIRRVFSVNIRPIAELGVGQEYQIFYTSELSGVLPSGDEEIAIGLDLTKKRAFVNPIRRRLQVVEDPNLRRYGKMGWYGDEMYGFACLDNRPVVLLSF